MYRWIDGDLPVDFWIVTKLTRNIRKNLSIGHPISLEDEDEWGDVFVDPVVDPAFCWVKTCLISDYIIGFSQNYPYSPSIGLPSLSKFSEPSIRIFDSGEDIFSELILRRLRCWVVGSPEFLNKIIHLFIRAEMWRFFSTQRPDNEL